MGHNKEYCSLDKMAGKGVCFSGGKVWREHRSLPSVQVSSQVFTQSLLFSCL